jgi:hypothetical protein
LDDIEAYKIVDQNRETKIILSLTSFPERIHESWVSIACLMKQSVRPDKIILWLSSEQFVNKQLPAKIKHLVELGLDVRYCDDLRSHKKYFYSMQEFEDHHVITFDDDLYYDSFVVENLINLKLQFPDSIVANRVHQMKFCSSEILPYTTWKHNFSKNIESYDLFHTSGAGVLFTPKFFDKNIFRKDLIFQLSYNSDDVWLKAMCLISKRKTATNEQYNKDFITVGSTQNVSLVFENTKKGKKDKQIKEVFKYFNLTIKDSKIQIHD